jgi:hypothetical protein
MFLIDLIFAVVVGLVITLIVMAASRRMGPWVSLPLAFLVVALAAWAAGRWLGPLGPRLFDGYWLPFVIGGVAALLLLAAAGAVRSSRTNQGEVKARRPADAAIGILMWLVVTLLLIAVIVAYI